MQGGPSLQLSNHCPQPDFFSITVSGDDEMLIMLMMTMMLIIMLTLMLIMRTRIAYPDPEANYWKQQQLKIKHSSI